MYRLHVAPVKETGVSMHITSSKQVKKGMQIRNMFGVVCNILSVNRKNGQVSLVPCVDGASIQSVPIHALIGAEIV
jgi:citrate lyase gamma subunit